MAMAERGCSLRYAGNHIWDQITPLDLLSHRDQIVLYELQDRDQIEFRIFQEANQQFQTAVARASPDTVKRAVKIFGVVDNALDSVGVGKLLLVMAMNPHLLAGQVFAVELDQILDLLAIQRAEAIDHIEVS